MIDIKAWKNTVNIIDVISKYTQLNRNSNKLLGTCPFHTEKTPSFFVFPETQSFNCFGCGIGGDVITFQQKINQVDFKTACQQLGYDGFDHTILNRKNEILSKRQEARAYRNQKAESKHKHLYEQFKIWKRGQIDELTTYVRCISSLHRNVKTVEDMENMAELIGHKSTLEYWLELLIQGDEIQQYYYYQEGGMA